ncbi:LacI family DNA-binding transcriptional regulator [Mycetocola sp.]|uniref:LacI family DNA-binding transcriptional regulator n=1 Tax=Mycetocola sp. TaxID=1871042 RepID=UPI00398919E5
MSTQQQTPSRIDKSGAPSMSDVAALAGVALGTVSNVLNHPQKVAAPTLRRVQAAIDELGFVRNDQARSLARGRSSTMGLIVTDIGNSFFVDIARGAEVGAQKGGMSLLLANSDNDLAKEQTYLDLFEQSRFAGILLAPFEASTEGLERIKERGQPLLLLNVATPADKGCSVIVDNEYGGYIAARHLIDLGRSRLAFVGGPDRLAPLLARRLGVERAIAESGGTVALEEIIVTAVNAPEGRAVADALIQRDLTERPDGIVAASDLLALGIIQRFQNSIRVPEDIAIIGYDNNNAVWDSLIPISTIGQPGFEMGVRGAELLADAITNPATHQHQVLTLLPHLMARASSVGHIDSAPAPLAL